MGHAHKAERLALVGAETELPAVLTLAPHRDYHEVAATAPAGLVSIAAGDVLVGTGVLIGVAADRALETHPPYRTGPAGGVAVEDLLEAEGRGALKEPLSEALMPRPQLTQLTQLTLFSGPPCES